ncbi:MULTISPECIES: PA0061/PA0062 family lipoprotein [Pseudomonas]|jgi:hypothetical protein|uniref:DUF2057 domain-containing protein n=1 Tax=Pseudomonas mosselii TaxID=78327 RepID=A0A5R8YL46_9PSED|nr:DUF2057 domain-containing protein [Pseudomonas mosselii]TLP53689.1 DUF2057 domain-containing protein [Pseudomonas mosselii]
MRQPLMLIALSALGACASPLPPVDPGKAWVDLSTTTPGRTIMADRLDGQRLNDGRYFQVSPGKHELVVRFDFEVYSGGLTSEPTERTCYLTVRFNDFKAGERYRLEARAPVMQPQLLMYDASRKVVVDEPSEVFCIP